MCVFANWFGNSVGAYRIFISLRFCMLFWRRGLIEGFSLVFLGIVRRSFSFF